MAAPYAGRVAGRPLAERVEETAAIMREQGGVVDPPRAEGGAYYMDVHTCPFPVAASLNRAVCAFRVQWVSILTGGDVRLTSSILRNQPACTFRIGRRPSGEPAPRHPRQRRARRS
jgi:predicted ArsR family transcriptional regulator